MDYDCPVSHTKAKKPAVLGYCPAPLFKKHKTQPLEEGQNTRSSVGRKNRIKVNFNKTMNLPFLSGLGTFAKNKGAIQ